MLITKELNKMAMKWRKAAAAGRKRILLQRTKSITNSNNSSTSSVADKGHSVVYTTDCRRYCIPLPYLNNDILKELLKMSEEEFGLPRNGPIILPCDSFFLEKMVSLIRIDLAKNQEKTKLKSVVTACCSLSPSLQEGIRHHNVIACN